jgi:hypothetical protein
MPILAAFEAQIAPLVVAEVEQRSVAHGRLALAHSDFVLHGGVHATARS